MIAKMV